VRRQFVERWARRYLTISAKLGRGPAVKWANTFLNPEDGERVAAAVKAIKEGRPVT
jgi:hypothetical protein